VGRKRKRSNDEDELSGEHSEEEEPQPTTESDSFASTSTPGSEVGGEESTSADCVAPGLQSRVSPDKPEDVVLGNRVVVAESIEGVQGGPVAHADGCDTEAETPGGVDLER